MPYELLIQQIADWHKSQEHSKIIQVIAALPKEEQTGELRSLLARAFLNEERFPEALSALDSIPEPDQDGLYCVRYGLALFISHREHEALVWFEKANEMGVKEFDELPGTYYPKSMDKWLTRAKTWAPRRVEKLAFENPLQRDWIPSTYSVESIFGVDCEKPYSLCGEQGSRFWVEEWGYPDIGIAICDTNSGGHDMVFLDYSDCGPQGEPCVVIIDQESDYETTYLADDFASFVGGLFEEDEEDSDDDE